MHNFSACLWSTLCTDSRRTAHPPWPTTHANALGSWCFGPSLAGAATTVAQQHRSVRRKKKIPLLPTLNSRILTGFRNFCGSGTMLVFNLVAPHIQYAVVSPVIFAGRLPNLVILSRACLGSNYILKPEACAVLGLLL
jgi:hypothetical protein